MKGKLVICIIAQCSAGTQLNLLPYALLIKHPLPVLIRSFFNDVQSTPEFHETRSEMPCRKYVRKCCRPARNPIRITADSTDSICSFCKLSDGHAAGNSSFMMGSSSCAIFRTPAGTAAGISVHYSVCLTVQCSVYRPYWSQGAH